MSDTHKSHSVPYTHSHNIFLEELTNHAKFTIGAVIVAALIVVILKNYFLTNTQTIRSSHFFEDFFIPHLFFAALTPAALFSLYNRNVWLGVFLSIATSSITCSLSDIVFPYLGGLLLSYPMEFHLCIIDEPIISWSFIIGGAVIGYFLSQYVRKLTRFTHTAHILLSSLAAGMYLIAYGVGFLSVKALLFIPILIFSVLIPCVMNDIGVPSYIVSLTVKSGTKKKEMLEELHKEHHGHTH